jgi:shikimate kinase
MPGPRSRRVLLVGMTWSGKTTVGQALTRITGRTCLDHDELVERATERPTPEVLVVDVDEETSDELAHRIAGVVMHGSSDHTNRSIR